MEDNNILQDDIDSQGDEISQADSSGSQSIMDISNNFSGNESTIFGLQDDNNTNSSISEEQEEDDERWEIQNVPDNIDINCEVLIFATILKILET